MYSRSFKVEDWPEILALKNKYYKGELSFADPTKNAVTDLVITDDSDKIIGFGIVGLFAEAVMILDQSLPARLKVQMLRAMMEEAIEGSKAYGLDYLHMFSKREGFLDVLKKHYGATELYKGLSIDLRR
jgi:hypothetical protein